MFKAYLKEKKRFADYSVSSAGLHAVRGDVLSKGADEALTFFGVSHTERKARMFTVSMSRDADVIVAMSERHAALCGDGDNVYSFEDFGAGTPIPDPFGAPTQVYIDCAAAMRARFDEIFALCERVRKAKANSEE